MFDISHTFVFDIYIFFFCPHAQLEKVRAELANANVQLAAARAAAGTEDTYVVVLRTHVVVRSSTEDTY